MKAYTDIEQSKKLADILPIESADMRYSPLGDTHPWFIEGDLIEADAVPCWSLVALLDVLPSASLDSSDDHYYRIHCNGKFSEWHDNPVDAAFEMVELLHKENLV